MKKNFKMTKKKHHSRFFESKIQDSGVLRVVKVKVLENDILLREKVKR